MFEYKVGILPFVGMQDELNAYGKDGWELVTCRVMQSSAFEIKYEAIFKRPVKAQATVLTG